MSELRNFDLNLLWLSICSCKSRMSRARSACSSASRRCATSCRDCGSNWMIHCWSRPSEFRGHGPNDPAPDWVNSFADWYHTALTRGHTDDLLRSLRRLHYIAKARRLDGVRKRQPARCSITGDRFIISVHLLKSSWQGADRRLAASRVFAGRFLEPSPARPHEGSPLCCARRVRCWRWSSRNRACYERNAIPPH
jgi:hypothetical protein